MKRLGQAGAVRGPRNARARAKRPTRGAFCEECRYAAAQYVRASLAHFLRDAVPTIEQQGGATRKVAAALHDLHVARAKRASC